MFKVAKSANMQESLTAVEVGGEEITTNLQLQLYQRCSGMAQVLPLLEKACGPDAVDAKSELVEFMVLGRDVFVDRWKQSIDILGLFMALLLSSTFGFFMDPPDRVMEGEDWRLWVYFASLGMAMLLHTMGLVGILIVYHWVNHAFRDADLIMLFTDGKLASAFWTMMIYFYGGVVSITCCFPVLAYNWVAGLIFAVVFNMAVIVWQSTLGPLGGVGGMPWKSSKKRADKVRISGMASVISGMMPLSIPLAEMRKRASIDEHVFMNFRREA